MSEQLCFLPGTNDRNGNDRGATISRCGRYRYALWRRWGDGCRLVNFVMLNPSTADALADDPTIRRCVRFARDWGFDGLEVTNLFACRATDPDELKAAADPIGPENDQHLLAHASRAGLIVCAWGAHRGERARSVRRLLEGEGYGLWCLSRTQGGDPGHPLYLRADLKPVPLEGRAGP